jgi:[ribosomal protein S18]-alanine N-acetyltransferase
VIRPMVWWDVPDVVSIENELFPVDSWSAELFWAELAGVGDSRDVAVLSVGETIVGYCSLRHVGTEGDINTIAIAASHQGQGLGSQLYDWMSTRAREHGVRQLFLEVRSDNEAAKHMYASLGFEEIDRRKDYYAVDVHALVMRKRLSDD